jgi:hypothetical protein
MNEELDPHILDILFRLKDQGADFSLIRELMDASFRAGWNHCVAEFDANLDRIAESN